jgi:hypothetical protein
MSNDIMYRNVLVHILLNHIGSVTVSVFASSVVGRGF